MKRSACIYTVNNGVGLIADLSLLQDILYDFYDIDVVYLSLGSKSKIESLSLKTYDVGIFLQDFNIDLLDQNTINILVANEEWAGSKKLPLFHKFDKILTKSTLGTELLRPYNSNIVNCGFISKDMYNSSIKKENNFLHVVGRSIQKGTENIIDSFIYNCKEHNITIIENIKRFDKYYKTPNINYISDFLSEEELIKHLNKNIFHICPSYYEGWGHYVYEGLSTGALLYVTRTPMFLEWLDPELVIFLDVEFIKQDENIQFFKSEHFGFKFPYKFGWKVNKDDFKEKILQCKSFLKNHNPEKVRSYYKCLMDKNKKKLIKELTNV